MEREEGEHFKEKIKAVDETGFSESSVSLVIEGGVGEGSQVKVQSLFDPQQLVKKQTKKVVTVFDVHEES